MFLQKSFEHNQSFPNVKGRKKSKKHSLLKSLKVFTGDELNSCSYSQDAISTSYNHNQSFNGSNKSFDIRPESRQSITKSLKKLINNEDAEVDGALSKSVLTMDAETFKVLTVNRQACRLLGYSPQALIGKKLSELLRMGLNDDKEALMTDICRARGNVVITCGKVMEAITKDGKEIPVSVWIKKVKGQADKLRCIVVLQPVIRVVAEVVFNEEGQLLSCDVNFPLIHGYSSSASMVGNDIHQFFPSYKLPQTGQRINKSIRKQHTTGLSIDGTNFPVSVYIRSQEKTAAREMTYSAAVWYFTSINGLLSVDSSGCVDRINNNFSLAMLGYCTDELTSMNIRKLLPGIEMRYSSLPQDKKEDFSETLIGPQSDDGSPSCGTFELLEHDTESFLQVTNSNQSPVHFEKKENVDVNESLGDSSWVELTMNHQRKSALDRINSLLNGSSDLLEEISQDSACHSTSGNQPASSNQPDDLDRSSRSPPFSDYQSDENSASNVNGTLGQFAVTSTPFEKRTMSRLNVTAVAPLEGHFEGQAHHKNGTLLDVEYDVVAVKNVERDVVAVKYFIWMKQKDHEYPSYTSSHLCSSFNSTLPSLNASAAGGALDFSLGAAIKQEAQHQIEDLPPPLDGDDEWHAIQGEFGNKYEVSQVIGNGAYGFVKTAIRKKDGKEMIVKFIRKEKVLDECWVDDYESDSIIPLEIALLTKFHHENIVHVSEFFENDRFFCMIMHKHGEFDLFEFIDRAPRMDEALASLIFRQIACGVNFLHRQGVVHRDIKDENVIIDRNFTCKLIDFGSAAFFKPGQTFATFCGTLEYCSPEVLLGSTYDGPELDMWALGVTLYTLVFGENPFQNIEETVEAKLTPPSVLSDDLMSIIRWLLEPVPEHRCLMVSLLDEPWLNQSLSSAHSYTWEEVFQLEPKAQFPENENKKDYNAEKENLLKSGKINLLSRENDAFPLTTRLENLNLNHSV